MKIAFTGRPSLGGVQMCGMSVAEELGIEFIDVRKLKPSHHFDVLILIKYWVDIKNAKTNTLMVRSCCDRLIYHPLDPWSAWKDQSHLEPKRFWKWVHKQLRPDDIIATSPACEKTMLDSHMPWNVHLMPHHADPRIESGWHDPSGPVVYAGGERFISNQRPQIEDACRSIRKRFVMNNRNDGWKSLRGASLVLHPRLPPHDIELNRHCKPQVKLENAAAARLPILATDDPCVTSLRPGVVTWSPWRSSDTWAGRMLTAIEAGPIHNPVTLQQHASRIEKVLNEQPINA